MGLTCGLCSRIIGLFRKKRKTPTPSTPESGVIELGMPEPGVLEPGVLEPEVLEPGVPEPTCQVGGPLQSLLPRQRLLNVMNVDVYQSNNDPSLVKWEANLTTLPV